MVSPSYARSSNSHHLDLKRIPRVPMALPIVLLRDKNQDLSHEQCLLAAFAHMTRLVDLRSAEDWGRDWQEPWDRWNTGKFRKIVKRANPQRFAGLAQDPQSIHSAVEIDGDLVELLSFPPYELSEQDPRVKPLQVAGLDCPKSKEIHPESTEELILAYDGSLGASTGKMMAQAGHAAQLLRSKYSELNPVVESMRVVDSFDQDDIEWLVEVVDAGFTEVAPNSVTVKIGRRIS